MSKKFLNVVLLPLVAGIAATMPTNSSLVVAGEGTWAYNATGALEFTAQAGFTGTATPLTTEQIASILQPSTQYLIVQPTAVGQPSKFTIAVTTEPKSDGTIGVGLLASGVDVAVVQGIVDAAIQTALQNSNFADSDDVEAGLEAVNLRINQTNANLQSLSGLTEALRRGLNATRFIKASTDPAETNYFLNVACTTSPVAADEANYNNFKLYATENGEYNVNGATVTLAKGDIVVMTASGVELLRQDSTRISAAETALAGINTQIAALQAVSKWTNGSIVQVGAAQAKLDAILLAPTKGIYAIAVRTNGDEEQTEVITAPSTATANWDANYTVRAGSQIELEIDENGEVTGFFVDNDSNAIALIVSLSDTVTALTQTVNTLGTSLTDLEDLIYSVSSNLNYLRTSFVNSEARPVHFDFDLAFASSPRITLRDIFAYFHGANPQELLGNTTNRFEMLIEFIDSREVKTPIQISEVVGFMTESDNGVAYQTVSEGDKIKTYFSRVNGNLEYSVDQVMQGKYYPNQSATIAQVEALAAMIDPNAFG